MVFMVRHRVYIFTDQLAAGSLCTHQEGWKVVVLQVCGAPHWQDVSMEHMVMVSCFYEQHFLCEVDDLVCRCRPEVL